MNLPDLFAKCGDKIKVQSLTQSMTGITAKKCKDGPLSEIKFLTAEITPTEVMTQTDKIGVICWIPRDELQPKKVKRK